jgi:hypothetical protein
LTFKAGIYFEISKEKDYSSEDLILKKGFVAPLVKVVIIIPAYNEEKLKHF